MQREHIYAMHARGEWVEGSVRRETLQNAQRRDVALEEAESEGILVSDNIVVGVVLAQAARPRRCEHRLVDQRTVCDTLSGRRHRLEADDGAEQLGRSLQRAKEARGHATRQLQQAVAVEAVGHPQHLEEELRGLALEVALNVIRLRAVSMRLSASTAQGQRKRT
jgi:hypothetical protein